MRMQWREFEEVCKAHGLTLPPGSPAGPVVQLEGIDFLDQRVSPRLLWMEGRGSNWKDIAEGLPEPRNPGTDNPLLWPRQYLERLVSGFRGRRRPRSDFRLERAALFAWLHGTGRLPPQPDWFLTGKSRWQKPPSFALIGQLWFALTTDWMESGVPVWELDDSVTDGWHPAELPETLRWLPQAVIAWDEWLHLPVRRAEEYVESTVRQHVTEVLRPA